MSYKSLINTSLCVLQKMHKTLYKSKSKWNEIAREAQKMPVSNWYIWLIMAGRGFGKTRTGAETIRLLIEQGYKRICFLGETYYDVRKVMVEGKSGILSIYDKEHLRPKFFPSRKLILYANGAQINLYSADAYETLRGPQFDAAWIDELAKFKYAVKAWNQLIMCLRLGTPKIIITTTPRNISLLEQIQNMQNIHITRGTTYDNRSNLSAAYIDYITKNYENTRFGLQEIYGEIIEEENNSLWSKKYFQYYELQNYNNIVVAVDPAISSSGDETGIIVAASDKNENYYVLNDLSGRYSMNQWAEVAIQAYYQYDAKSIIVEINQGGNMIKEMLYQIDRNNKENDNTKHKSIHVTEVRATKGKRIRAEPIAMLYEQGRVFHRKFFSKLESQMLSFHLLKESPDRIDALVWGIQYLLNKKRMSCYYL